MESQALGPEGKGLPVEAAKATRINPAGMRRKEATKKGPRIGKTSFIATIAVPQKKKGLTSTPFSINMPMIVFFPSSLSSSSSSSSSFFTKTNASAFGPESEEETATHSASEPVPKQSTSILDDDCSLSINSWSLLVVEQLAHMDWRLPFLPLLLILHVLLLPPLLQAEEEEKEEDRGEEKEEEEEPA
uniref:WAT1-related protein At3g02690ic isoform X2 n=1 Tax=Rhizophora mucronata TaxID=61149 RepID=A0A2P2LQE5_RHIMU